MYKTVFVLFGFIESRASMSEITTISEPKVDDGVQNGWAVT